MSKRPRGSWENPKDRDKIHSPEGVEKLRQSFKDGLYRYYTGIAESMWKWDLSGEAFQDMFAMTRGKYPEKLMFQNGSAVWFRDPKTDQIHCLPYTANSDGINIYGEMTSWHPVPAGWSDSQKIQYSDVVSRFSSMKLTSENSVIMNNDLFGQGDSDMISAVVACLVDNLMTANQLQLLAKSPFIFNVTEDNLLTAKNFFLALSQDKPAIFVNKLADDSPIPQTEALSVQIDPSIFELYDRWDCQGLTYLGYPCVPITKRAQQTVSEVQSNDSRVYTRRMEKLAQRERACELIKEVLGADISVVSTVDERAEQAMKDAQGEEQDDERSVDNDE